MKKTIQTMVNRMQCLLRCRAFGFLSSCNDDLPLRVITLLQGR